MKVLLEFCNTVMQAAQSVRWHQPMLDMQTMLCISGDSATRAQRSTRLLLNR
jgi:hypothetical protein